MSHLKFKLQVWWDEYHKGRKLSGIRPTGFHKSNPFLLWFWDNWVSWYFSPYPNMSGATATIQNNNARGKGERGGGVFYLSKSDWRRGRYFKYSATSIIRTYWDLVWFKLPNRSDYHNMCFLHIIYEQKINNGVFFIKVHCIMESSLFYAILLERYD